MEAGRANAQVETLRRQEEKRQQKAIRARQINERTEVQIAHNMQYTDFNAAWDKYMEEYDNMAEMYIQQMTERHAVKLLEFQRGLQKEMTQKVGERRGLGARGEATKLRLHRNAALTYTIHPLPVAYSRSRRRSPPSGPASSLSGGAASTSSPARRTTPRPRRSRRSPTPSRTRSAGR